MGMLSSLFFYIRIHVFSTMVNADQYYDALDSSVLFCACAWCFRATKFATSKNLSAGQQGKGNFVVGAQVNNELGDACG
jgi:hypothetical protein